MVLSGDQVTLHPVTQADVAALVEIRRAPAVRRWWGEVDDDPGWPFDEPGTMCFTVVHAGAVVGLVQYHEETEPRYRHAGIDILLDPAVHGRGLGRDAVRAVARHLVRERGHHRLVIDPAADNEQAIRCYASVGFRPVGVMRWYERDADDGGWHDGLLMELLAHELT